MEKQSMWMVIYYSTPLPKQQSKYAQCGNAANIEQFNRLGRKLIIVGLWPMMVVEHHRVRKKNDEWWFTLTMQGITRMSPIQALCMLRYTRLGWWWWWWCSLSAASKQGCAQPGILHTSQRANRISKSSSWLAGCSFFLTGSHTSLLYRVTQFSLSSTVSTLTHHATTPTSKRFWRNMVLFRIRPRPNYEPIGGRPWSHALLVALQVSSSLSQWH